MVGIPFLCEAGAESTGDDDTFRANLIYYARFLLQSVGF